MGQNLDTISFWLGGCGTVSAHWLGIHVWNTGWNRCHARGRARVLRKKNQRFRWILMRQIRWSGLVFLFGTPSCPPRDSVRLTPLWQSGGSQFNYRPHCSLQTHFTETWLLQKKTTVKKSLYVSIKSCYQFHPLARDDECGLKGKQDFCINQQQ